MPESGQMPLRLRWPARQRFEHFVVGANALAMAACVRAARESDAPWVYLSGPAGSGKSHLLLAACQHASSAGRSAQYLSLADLPAQPDQAIRGLGGTNLVALDNLDALPGQAELQHALFDLYNRLRSESAVMLFASSAPVQALSLELRDLVSRLGACTQIPLRPLDEPARRSLLRDSAAARGMELDDKVLDWLFRYHARDLGSLGQLLDRLDQASLAQHRRITIPFLRELLHGGVNQGNEERRM